MNITPHHLLTGGDNFLHFIAENLLDALVEGLVGGLLFLGGLLLLLENVEVQALLNVGHELLAVELLREETNQFMSNILHIFTSLLPYIHSIRITKNSIRVKFVVEFEDKISFLTKHVFSSILCNFCE